MIKMAARIFFHPVLALVLFMIGIWMASTINILCGLITILGGGLLGFSPLRRIVSLMNEKTKLLFYASFIFLLILISATFLVLV
ncbi:hypothetical protein MXL46_17570 [Heyndrickxia sporothermodurans]|uniref:Uncharacterized protein n=3 Tax=Heyndrickxia sporothermodurans TaxID=46224 RepID=A0AB37HH68_9BACI|nr:hypothetical protein [Heyndrickxia sporothermodurans]MBL5775150.1 hypothetical protein [Heyndrickxia sporothermodurans]MBL5778583.1 hypothetical protein [Heyndrickxia sporothermodurans]MBL5782168.1 hypothetical protein [Heyndrickxia sporothermodurans]MBL5785783.1 hypothetical protein [Heyndrickxia sporothermodurans]MBL5789285.1 hypothetical protein [Heyndrickxia sporothermodurans]